MKKIVVALLSCVCTAAIAEELPVAIYGLLDIGYSWRGDNYDGRRSARNGIDGGQAAGSRIGFRGEEGLSDAMKAYFVIEAGIQNDIGASAQGGVVWGRQALVGISHSEFGKVSLGRQYTPHFQLFAAADPFAMGTVGRIDNLWKGIQARQDNAVVLSSSYLGGVAAVDIMYSLHGVGTEHVGNAGDVPYVNVVPKLRLAGGAFNVMGSYARWKTKGTPERNEVWDLVGIYSQGGYMLSGGYGRFNNYADALGQVQLIKKRKARFDRFFVGGTVPIGSFSLLGSYIYSKDTGDAGYNAQQVTFGTKYRISKRTSIYAAYARIVANNEAGEFGGYDVAAATTPGMGYRSGLSMGLTHIF